MGVGYDTNEAATVKYSNFMDEMVSQGIIPIKAYSLYLNDLKSSVCLPIAESTRLTPSRPAQFFLVVSIQKNS